MCDKRVLSDVLDELGLLYDREVPVALKKLYFEDLGELTDEELRAAARAHRRDPERGRFFPKPADLLAKVARPAVLHLPSDAAWALAVQSFDEAQTVVWTAEIAEARAVALPIWQAGDVIGARMAFRAAYERLTAAATPPVWTVTLGQDESGRAQAIQAAVERGLLPAAKAALTLPSPESADGGNGVVAGLLGNVSEHPSAAAGRLRQLAQMLREGSAARDSAKQRAGRERGQRIEAAKEAAAAGVEAMQRERDGTS
jgi:hypothetical protein